MIDFVKCSTKVSPKQIRLNPNLNFLGQYVHATSEADDNKLVADIQNLKCKSYSSGYFQLSGSLHQYFNNGLHNHNDFHLSELKVTIECLCDMLEINPSNFNLENVEVGYNLELPFNTTTLLDSLCHHKGKPFKYMKVKQEGEFLISEHSDYVIKAYNKALQSDLPNNLFRLENHYNKMRLLQKIGINALSDLTDASKLNKLNKLLTSEWNNTFLIAKELNSTQYSHWANKDFWNVENKRSYPTKRQREREKYFEVLKKKRLTSNNKYHLQETVSELLSKKITQCLEG